MASDCQIAPLFQGVMAGLVPAIHVVRYSGDGVDARDKPGHDGTTY